MLSNGIFGLTTSENVYNLLKLNYNFWIFCYYGRTCLSKYTWTLYCKKYINVGKPEYPIDVNARPADDEQAPLSTSSNASLYDRVGWGATLSTDRIFDSKFDK